MSRKLATAWDLTAADRALISEIQAVKAALGPKLLILTHHYQRPEIVALGDYRGDSLALAQKAAADHKVRSIVFCGVHFMAESAAILAHPHQVVQIPDLTAGCQMADMVDLELAEMAWEELVGIVGEGTVVPIVYVNSDAYLKAFCGQNGGLACTSANALAAIRWGLAQRAKVFFFPDQHLGRNTGNRLGLKPEEMAVWDPEQPLGGNDPAALRRARLILWDGHCHVHTRFRVEHIREMRATYPDARVVVHPECTEEVVAQADACGSTGFIVAYVRQASPGSTIIVGTEINLVSRLAWEFPDRQILDLHHSLCPNMFKINPAKLLKILERPGEANVVEVPADTKAGARLALERMLAIA